MKNKDFNKSYAALINYRGNITDEFLKIFRNGKEEQIFILLHSVSGLKFYKERFDKICKTSDINDLLSEGLIPSLVAQKGYSDRNFDQDILTMICFLQLYSNNIRDFQEKRCLFEHYFLNGLFYEAGEILDSVFNATGYSFWYLEMKLLLLSTSDHAKYRAEYRAIKDSIKEPLIVKHIRLIKRKIHLGTKQKDFKSFYHDNIGVNQDNDDGYNIYRDYVEFSNFIQAKAISNDIKRSIGIVLHSLSLIDAFLLLEKFLDYYCTFEPGKNSARLYNKFSEIIKKPNVERGQVLNKSKRLLVEKKYKECIDYCFSELGRHGDWLELVEICVKANLYLSKNFDNKETPLDRLLFILESCYIKSDGTMYGAGYIDICDRYYRALSNFSSSYDILALVLDTMEPPSIALDNYRIIRYKKRQYDCIECVIFLNQNMDYYKRLVGRYGKQYCCDWELYRYSFDLGNYDIQFDYFTLLLDSLRSKTNTILKMISEEPFLYEIYYQEYMRNSFQRSIEIQDYGEAIHIYMDLYFHNPNMVVKLNAEELNFQMVDSRCRSYLDQIDFFLYYYLMKSTTNRYVYDDRIQRSFGAILKKYSINKPSMLIETEHIDNSRLEKFLDFCCNPILLHTSPCDLYNVDLYEEQIKILSYLYEKTGAQRFLEHRRVAEFRKEYLKLVSGNNKGVQSLEKLNADWIYLEQLEDVLGEFEKITGFSGNEIANDDEKYEIFSRALFSAKREYVYKVNEQFGSTIRHGILDGEVKNLLKENNLFIPEVTEDEKKTIIQENLVFKGISEDKREETYRILKEKCKKLFSDLEDIKKRRIYFVNEKNPTDRTSAYVEDNELKEMLSMNKAFNNQNDFIRLLTNIIEHIICLRLPLMRDNVVNDLSNAINQYYSSVSEELKKMDCKCIDTDKFMVDLENMLSKIKEWFKLIHDGDKLLDLETYINRLSNNKANVKVEYIGGSCAVKLSVLSMVHIIIVNMIQNVEEHSGFVDDRSAQAIISVHNDETKEEFTIDSQNYLSKSVEYDEILKNVQLINEPYVPEPNNIMLPPDKYSHGKGYQTLKRMLYGTYKDPFFKAEVLDNKFCIKAKFKYGEVLA